MIAAGTMARARLISFVARTRRIGVRDMIAGAFANAETTTTIIIIVSAVCLTERPANNIHV